MGVTIGGVLHGVHVNGKFAEDEVIPAMVAEGKSKAYAAFRKGNRLDVPLTAGLLFEGDK